MQATRGLAAMLLLVSSCSFSFPPDTKPTTDGLTEAGASSDAMDAQTDGLGSSCEGAKNGTPCEVNVDPFIDCDGMCSCCGGTCQRCAFFNSTASCVNGACQDFECAAGWGNCDDDILTGCETDVTTSVDHCGSCDNKIQPDDDSDNCGACGRSCEGGACVGGVCQPVIIAQSDDYSHFNDMALFDGSLYLAQVGDSKIQKVDKTSENDSSVQTLANEYCSGQIAVDSESVHWLAPTGSRRRDHADGKVSTTTTTTGSRFALGGAHVYLAAGKTVYWASKDGLFAVAEQIAEADGPISDMVADSGGVYLWVQAAMSPVELGQIVHWSAASLEAVTLDSFDGTGGDLVIGGDFLYYTSSDGKIHRLDRLSSGAPPELVYSNPSSLPRCLAADEQYLYWCELFDVLGTDKVRRKRISDPPEAFEEIWEASPDQMPLKILLDEKRIFILVFGQSTLPSLLLKQIKPRQ